MDLASCKIWINNTSHGVSDLNWIGTITGCSGSSADAQVEYSKNACNADYTWEKYGVNASTTGNMYGIYDMSGGLWEFVMGNMVNADETFSTSESGFIDKIPGIDQKYYDSYTYDTSGNYLSHNRGHLGDATREILKTCGNYRGGWNNVYTNFPNGSVSWFNRGGRANDNRYGGIFAFYYTSGNGIGTSFRSVLTAQDGAN